MVTESSLLGLKKNKSGGILDTITTLVNLASKLSKSVESIGDFEIVCLKYVKDS